MSKLFSNSFGKNDHGVSPVIGTILMVAVTVVLGATVYAAIGGVGSDDVQESVNAVWKAQAVDTDGDGRTDTLKITYLTGPPNVAATDVSVQVSPTPVDGVTHTGGWDAGDFVTYTTTGDTAATYFVTVSMLGSTLLDTSVSLQE